jgi:hypothetical protein
MGYLLCLLLASSFATALNQGGGASRRLALKKISSTVALGLGGLFPVPVSLARDADQVDDSFTTYNIIPDASANLDPRLVKVKNDIFLSELASSRNGGAIWLGEHHNSLRDHRFQAEFVRSIHKDQQRVKAPMAIGLEQVQIQFQYVLDDYIQGGISLEEMRRLVDWDQRWTWPFEGYAPVFEAAKELNIQLVALNVDSEDLVKVEKQGYPGLPNDRLRKYIKDP